MPVDRATVEHVARLARLELDEEEAGRLARELERLLGWVDGLAAVDTEGVAPTTHAPEGTPRRRPDTPSASLSVDEALANAPATAEGTFAVPAVLPGEAPP